MARIFFIFPLLWMSYVWSVQDPYLWLENDDGADTQAWLAKQRTRYEEYQQANPYIQEFEKSLEGLSDREFPKSFVRTHKNYLVHQKNALFIQKGLEGEPQLLLDVDRLSQESTFTLAAYVPSPNGKLVAYGLSENGSDWNTWNILDIDAKQTHAESTGKTKFSTVCWSADSLGFYYSCFEKSGVHGVYYHRLGDTQEQDELVYRDLNNKSHFYIPRLSSDRRYLLIDIITGSMAPNSFLCLDLEHVQAPILTLIPFDGATYWFVCNRGLQFYFTTTKEASCRKLIVVDIENPSKRKDIISEKTALLADVLPIGNHFLISYVEDVCSKLFSFDCEGKELRSISLPDKGVVKFWHGCPDSQGTRDCLEEESILFSFSNLVRPPVLYRWDLSRDEPAVFRKSKIELDSADYSMYQIFYPSKDGTKIPLFIAHKKDVKRDHKTPTILTGHGGFSMVNLPVYNPAWMAWLQQGGIVASASIRGGGEYGAAWHLAGVKDKQQNSIDDLLAGAEWLLENAYTNPKQLSLYGFSNSAMLAAACANQRPELFGAIAATGGVYDMIRYPLFSLGRFWVLEYGNPDDPVELDFIKKYSPYHNIKRETHYPAMLVMASDRDTRVLPLHSYKYAAALQEVQCGDGKMLLRVKDKAGHFAYDSIDDVAAMLAFLRKELEKQ